MKKYILSILTLSVMLFSGCQKENTEIIDAPYNGEVRLASGIEFTRASGTNWAQNDKVGIYMLDNSEKTALSANIQYNNTATGGALATFGVVDFDETIYYPQSGTVDLFGYYPFQENVSNYIYKVDVSTQTTLSAIDLMVSDKIENITKNKNAQNLNFKHKLSNIVLTISAGAGVTTGELSSIVATIVGANTEADYNLKDNNGFTTLSVVENIEMVVTNSGQMAEALIIPQASGGVTLKFAIPNVGDFTTALPSDLDTGTPENQTMFLGGSKYTFSVTINRTAVGLGATITEWTTVNGGALDANEEELPV